MTMWTTENFTSNEIYHDINGHKKAMSLLVIKSIASVSDGTGSEKQLRRVCLKKKRWCNLNAEFVGKLWCHRDQTNPKLISFQLPTEKYLSIGCEVESGLNFQHENRIKFHRFRLRSFSFRKELKSKMGFKVSGSLAEY